MTKNAMFKKFCDLFPGWENVINKGSIRKVGSRSICMNVPILNDQKVFFMYRNDTDWSFGTKTWRRRPE